MLFDAHNHIHLGQHISPTLFTTKNFAGLSIMSTHPRDFPLVDQTCATFQQHGVSAVPCYGAHPWFLHEIVPFKQQQQQEEEHKEEDDISWMNDLKEILKLNPNACVGEIGLDGIRWHIKPGQLATNMITQQRIFESQLKIASELDRPVSIHVVQAWGPLFQSLKRVKSSNVGLPKSMYFHSFAGKPMTHQQLVKACDGSTLYFGFAPFINFKSPKTRSVIECVGIHQIVLETDLENSDHVLEDLGRCADFIADVFGMDVEEVLDQTYDNAKTFYRIHD